MRNEFAVVDVNGVYVAVIIHRHVFSVVQEMEFLVDTIIIEFCLIETFVF